MERFSAPLLGGRLVFSKYPTPEELDVILSNGFTHIVDLCTPDEMTWEPYVCPGSVTVIKYPFVDGKVQAPLQGWDSFLPFIRDLIEILSTESNKLLIHCKGGHGRSATIVGIIYGLVTKTDAETTIIAVHAAHQSRTEMLPKWRKLGAPQRNKQKDIIRKYLK